MPRAAVVLALVVTASGCGNKRDAPAAAGGEQTGPAAGGDQTGLAAGGEQTGPVPIAPSGPDPWAKPANAAPCDDTELRTRIEAGLASSSKYAAALEKRAARWKKDCEAARRDLVALEPDATAFVSAMTEFAAWGATLSPACRARVEELGEQSPLTVELDKRMPVLESRVKPILERCQDHPGFADAATKGLRLLRKKR